MHKLTRISLVVVLMTVLSAGALSVAYTHDAVTHTEQEAEAWPWDGLPIEYACAAGLGSLAYGVITGGQYINEHPEVSKKWLFLWSLNNAVALSLAVPTCYSALKNGGPDKQVRNFCTRDNRFYLGSSYAHYWAPGVGWFSVEYARWYRFECGGYTGYGYTGVPGDPAWPSPCLVFGPCIYGL